MCTGTKSVLLVKMVRMIDQNMVKSGSQMA
jgi:hypothetical protein